MKLKLQIFAVLFLFSCKNSINAQTSAKLYQNYEQYKEASISKKRFKHADIVPLIKKRQNHPLYKVIKAGESVEGRDIYMLRLGTGKAKVLLWSQMHGNEPTATMAILDIFNFFEQNDALNDLRKKLLDNLSLYFIPMLNPDGADRFIRQNAMGVDLNRDALRLQNPEARILKQAQQSIQPEWGFNLHDQSRYYAAGRSNKPASLSFLAPAFNEEKSVDGKRADAMRLIVTMNDILQPYIPGQIAKYSDAFEPRAFGDNIQKWGTRTILIESGGQYKDPENQYLRKLNFIALMGAFESIMNQTYEENTLKSYDAIPYNNRSLYDLIIREAIVIKNGERFKLDLAFNRAENQGATGLYYQGQLAYIGDLSVAYGYEELDAKGYTVQLGKTHPLTFETVSDATQTSFEEYYRQGYTNLKVLQSLPQEQLEQYPVQFLEKKEKADADIRLWSNPNFFLIKNGKKEYVVVNGKLYKL
ncbi:MAG: M14 metallopeptidase family protein [Bacteroidota bacterium]